MSMDIQPMEQAGIPKVRSKKLVLRTETLTNLNEIRAILPGAKGNKQLALPFTLEAGCTETYWGWTCYESICYACW